MNAFSEVHELLDQYFDTLYYCDIQKFDVVFHPQAIYANTAFARVRCSIGERDFVDMLSLVRTEGRWHIIAKIFQIIEKQGESNALR